MKLVCVFIQTPKQRSEMKQIQALYITYRLGTVIGQWLDNAETNTYLLMALVILKHTETKQKKINSRS